MTCFDCCPRDLSPPSLGPLAPAWTFSPSCYESGVKIVVPGAENAAREALDRLGAGQRRVAIVGPQGCGKSAALAHARALLAKDARVISLAFPRTGDDAALVVLCTLATELAVDEPGLVAEVPDPKTPSTASIFARRRAELSDTLLMNRAIIASRTSALPRPRRDVRRAAPIEDRRREAS